MKFLEIYQSGSMGSDCTSSYKVKIKGTPTLKEILPELIDSGMYVSVNGIDCITSSPYTGFSEDELNSIVTCVKGCGGYGRMSYNVTLDKNKTYTTNEADKNKITENPLNNVYFENMLFQYLKNNLKIEIDDESTDWTKSSDNVVVRLKLGDEIISVDSFNKN